MVSVDRSQPGVVWFRRDLRVADNPAWAAATEAHDEVVALFVVEPGLMATAGRPRRDQLLAHLGALDGELRERGGALAVRRAPADDAVSAVVTECGASALYLNADVSPFARRRDGVVAGALSVPMRVFEGTTVHPPGSVLTRKGGLSQVFTPFHKTWAATDLVPWPDGGEGRPITLPSDPVPDPEGPVHQPAGEANAWRRVTEWLERVDDYPDSRDLPAVAGTSELSADLKFGTLAARTLVDVVGTSTPGRAAFVRQLAWRDWWTHTLALNPGLADDAVRPEYARIVWRDDPVEFDRWCAGRTGFPIVDAGMRQLTETGWMHNRLRMICASFLVKDLLIDWRKGERFFRHHLVDADIAQNAGNWQWVAGTGPDAAPYFRVFNPTRQAERFDPTGDYVRRWVPELADLPAPVIHEPHLADPEVLATAGVKLGVTYPEPVVDHAEARDRAIEAYERARR